MKKYLYLLTLLFIGFAALTSCEKSEETPPPPTVCPDEVPNYENGIFVVNEGSAFQEDGFLSFIDPCGNITDSVYYKVNGKCPGNTLQDMYIANGKIYMVAQNGENMDGEGSFIIADARTLKKIAAYPKDKFSNNSWPAHVAVIGNSVFIQGGSGITLFDETAKTFTLIAGTNGATRNNMAVVGTKLFASAGGTMLVIETKTGTPQVERVTCPGNIGGIIKSDDGNLWLACGGSPSTITKVDATTHVFLAQHQITEVALGLSRRTSPTICAKGDIIYMKAEGDRVTQIWRHNFTSNQTKMMVDVSTKLENAKQGYNAINVDPKTGYVYINTNKGYGMDYLINDLSGWDFSVEDAPTMKVNFQNHTHFPAGVYFTDSFK